MLVPWRARTENSVPGRLIRLLYSGIKTQSRWGGDPTWSVAARLVPFHSVDLVSISKSSQLAHCLQNKLKICLSVAVMSAGLGQFYANPKWYSRPEKCWSSTTPPQKNHHSTSGTFNNKSSHTDPTLNASYSNHSSETQETFYSSSTNRMGNRKVVKKHCKGFYEIYSKNRTECDKRHPEQPRAYETEFEEMPCDVVVSPKNQETTRPHVEPLMNAPEARRRVKALTDNVGRLESYNSAQYEGSFGTLDCSDQTIISCLSLGSTFSDNNDEVRCEEEDTMSIRRAKKIASIKRIIYGNDDVFDKPHAWGREHDSEEELTKKEPSRESSTERIKPHALVTVESKNTPPAPKDIHFVPSNFFTDKSEPKPLNHQKLHPSDKETKQRKSRRHRSPTTHIDPGDGKPNQVKHTKTVPAQQAQGSRRRRLKRM